MWIQKEVGMPVYLIKQRVDDSDIVVTSESVGYFEGEPQDADAVVNALNERDPEVGKTELFGYRRNCYFRVELDKVTLTKVNEWFPQ
jgi:hypothetical protein